MYNVLNYVSPIPFYKSKDSLDMRNDYAFGETYHNIMYFDGASLHVPSFLLHTDVPFSQVTGVTALLRSVKDPSDTIAIPTSSAVMLNDSQLLTVVFTESAISQAAKGPYMIEAYVVIPGGTEVFYSDLLYVTDNIMNYVKISWYNETDLEVAGRIIPFTNGFRPSCYVDSHIGKPEYRYEEESTSRLGYEFVESVLSKKTYRFAFVLPEYMCDAMRLAKVCHRKRVTRYDVPNYAVEYNPMNISFDVDWEELGNLAGVTFTFDVDNVMSNTSGYLTGNGDFNNDYNNDFSNL